ncbi:hypothetical protein H4696_003311 [Amycolatopsis lexingtonensis]|uniref:Uncharacterized protein n=1 Tax=Amycolatopsis lexingtonensis TaxID=218822 RepID=A0ABR9HZ64_9PSEU|nr:hypothetical protein [Amycolatopsis lexingtonensis]
MRLTVVVIPRQGRQPVEVVALVGVDVRLHRAALGVRQLVGGGAPPVEAAAGQLLAHRHACPLQCAGHRGDGQLERVGGLRRRPAEDVAQDEHRPLPRRQVLDGDDERQIERLPRHRRFLRVLGEHPVGVRLQVRQLGAGVRKPGRQGVRLSRKSRQTFVAIRYSQVRSAAWPLNVSLLFHARRNVSCVMSWASS